jgi:hypothetical protein
VGVAHYTFDLEPMASEARREWFTHYAARLAGTVCS